MKFYSFFSPASIVGSGLKWYKLSSPGKEAEALSAIAFGRVWDVFVAIFFGLFWMLLGFGSNIIHPGFLALILFVLILGWFALMKLSPILSNWAGSHEMIAKKKGFKILYSSISKIFEAIRGYKSFSVKELLILISVSIFRDIISLIGHTLLVSALHIPISFIDLGWMRSIFFLSALAPFTMVGGIGLREVSVVLVMSAFGINAELAVAYSFLGYARSVLLHLVGGVIELVSSFRFSEKL